MCWAPAILLNSLPMSYFLQAKKKKSSIYESDYYSGGEGLAESGRKYSLQHFASDQMLLKHQVGHRPCFITGFISISPGKLGGYIGPVLPPTS